MTSEFTCFVGVGTLETINECLVKEIVETLL